MWQVWQRKEVWEPSKLPRRAAPSRCGLGPDHGKVKVKVEAHGTVILDAAVRLQYTVVAAFLTSRPSADPDVPLGEKPLSSVWPVLLLLVAQVHSRGHPRYMDLDT